MPRKMIETKLETRDDFLNLPPCTLYMLSLSTCFDSPSWQIPMAIRAGQYSGILTTDENGKFVSFR